MSIPERPFRFGYQPIGLTERDEIVDAARRAEDLGYAEYFSSDHLGIPDPFLPLVVAAEATTTLRVGPLVLNNEFHNTALLARAAATLDRLTGGRLVLGLGAGYAAHEHDAIGSPLPPAGARVGRLLESLGALRQLLDEGSVELEGHDRLAVDSLGIAPAQDRVPLLVGANGRRLVRGAAAHADIVQFTGADVSGGGLAPTAFGLDDARRRHDWLVEAAGPRMAEIEISALVQRTGIGATAVEQRADLSARWGLEPDVIDGSPYALLGDSVDAVCHKLERLRVEIGVSHFVVRDAVGFSPVVERLAGR